MHTVYVCSILISLFCFDIVWNIKLCDDVGNSGSGTILKVGGPVLEKVDDHVVISKTKTKESNAKSGWARPTQFKKWVGHWPTWPTRFHRHWLGRIHVSMLKLT